MLKLSELDTLHQYDPWSSRDTLAIVRLGPAAIISHLRSIQVKERSGPEEEQNRRTEPLNSVKFKVGGVTCTLDTGSVGEEKI